MMDPFTILAVAAGAALFARDIIALRLEHERRKPLYRALGELLNATAKAITEHRLPTTGIDGLNPDTGEIIRRVRRRRNPDGSRRRPPPDPDDDFRKFMEKLEPPPEPPQIG